MKIDDLHKLVIEVEKSLVKFSAQLEQTSVVLERLTSESAETVRSVEAIRLELRTELVAVKKDIEALRGWTEKNGVSDLKSQFEVLKEKVVKLEAALEKIGTRAWSVIPNIAGALVNVLLAALVAFLVSKYGK